MPFHHVLLALDASPTELQCVLSDLSKDELENKFVIPYRIGKDIICGNTVVPVSQIKKIYIVCTARNIETERAALHDRSLRELDEFNSQSDSIVLLSPGRGYDPEDILEVGEDVTSNYIFGPPGYEAKLKSDNPPDTLQKVILSWANKQFGLRGVIVILALLSLPPLFYFAYTHIQKLNLQASRHAEEWLSMNPAAVSAQSLYYSTGYAHAPIGLIQYYTLPSVEKATCLLGVKQTRVEFPDSTHTDEKEDGVKMQLNYSIPLSKVSLISTSQWDSDSRVAGNVKFSSATAARPYKVIISTGQYPLILLKTQYEKILDAYNNDGSLKKSKKPYSKVDETQNTNSIDIPVVDEANARELERSINIAVTACQKLDSVFRFKLE